MANLNNNISGWRNLAGRAHMSDVQVQEIMGSNPGARLIGARQKMDADGRPTGYWDLSKAKITDGAYVKTIWDF